CGAEPGARWTDIVRRRHAGRVIRSAFRPEVIGEALTEVRREPKRCGGGGGSNRRAERPLRLATRSTSPVSRWRIWAVERSAPPRPRQNGRLYSSTALRSRTRLRVS